MQQPGEGVLLFGIDLEDVLSMIPDGERQPRRVPQNTRRILDFVEALGARCTCFTVGNVARRHPELIQEILARGHEIACHSREHITLDQHDAASFRRDLEGNLEDLARCGAPPARGFRAPIGSLDARADWAYRILADLGFRYSSSVLPARSAFFGWPGFGEEPRRLDGVWEIPITLLPRPLPPLPFAGGTYLRVLPYALIHFGARRRIAQGRPLVSHIHPYDVDTEQARFMHPGLNGNRLLNALMYWNRDRVFERFERLQALGLRVLCYADYVAERLEGGPGAG